MGDLLEGSHYPVRYGLNKWVVLMVIIAAFIGLGSCSVLNSKVGLPDDNFIEEAIEEAIGEQLDVEIDLTPDSEES